MVLGDEWARRLAPDVAVFAMHPGWVATPGLSDSLPGFDKVMGPLLRDAAGGADTIVWLAGSPAVAGQTGGFWHDRRRRPEHRIGRTKETATERVRFFEKCERLAGVEAPAAGAPWSEDLTGLGDGGGGEPRGSASSPSATRSPTAAASCSGASRCSPGRCGRRGRWGWPFTSYAVDGARVGGSRRGAARRRRGRGAPTPTRATTSALYISG